MITIEKNTHDSVAEWKLQGWLDTGSAPVLADALAELPEDTEQLILDFAGVEYISSAGLRQIVAAHKQVGGNLTLRHLNNEIQNVIRMTGLDRRLHIEE